MVRNIQLAAADMNTRKNKRRVMRLLHCRLHIPVLWRSAEEQAWLDMPPVGREFGSRDYERLNILDMFARGEMSEVDALAHLKLDHDGLVAMLERDGLFQ